MLNLARTYNQKYEKSIPFNGICDLHSIAYGTAKTLKE